jgi:two-component system phosphate regulon sensor histidine kinase PhoR
MTLKKENNTRILVVDDDRQLADMLVEYLVRLGYKAAPAYGGREGLARFEQDDFKLVLLDLKMPDMGGMEVLEAIKSIDNRAVVMVLSGFGTIESAVTAIKKGAYDFIPKPVELNALGTILDRALREHALSRQLERFRGLIFALVVSVPLWLILSIMLANKFWKE